KVFYCHYDVSIGRELFATDGTTIGTTLVKDLYPGVLSGCDFWNNMVEGPNSNLIFSAMDTLNNYEIWISDGSSSGTSQLKDINTGNSGIQPMDLKPFNGGVIFTGVLSNFGQELFISDGTNTGTFMLKDINPGPSGSYIYDLCPIGNKYLFVAYSDTYGQELFITDGTSVGTELLKDIYASAAS